MQVYQLYCAASIFTTLQRPNPSLVLNYTAMDTVLGIQGWLYDKNGKKPVKNLPGSPIDSPDPLFLLSSDPYVPPFKVDPFRFQLLNISNKLYDSIVGEINNHHALTIVFKPQMDGVNLVWEIYVSTESTPPFTNIYLVPVPFQATTSFNPSPPKELAQ